LSSCGGELVSRVACFCVEDDEEFAGEGDADDHFGLSGGLQPVLEGGEVRVVLGDDAGDDEEDAAGSGTAAADRAAAAALAAVVGEGGEADELADGAVGEAADLGHFGEQAGDGALGDALDLAEGPIEAGPEGIVVDERGDLAFEVGR
jgi:hypothetical protein